MGTDHKPLLATVLQQSGFEELCNWAIDDSGALEVPAVPTAGGVYAFAIDGVVMYVGVAANSLAQRLRYYAKPGATQRTSQRVGGLICESCKAQTEVTILAAFPDGLSWNGLAVCGNAGLEAGLIAAYDLPWNIRGARKSVTRAKRIDNKASTTADDEYWVYENWVRNKAIVHRGRCSFCKNGNGLHGSRETPSSVWHGPFDSASAAMKLAKSCRRDRTEGCATCAP